MKKPLNLIVIYLFMFGIIFSNTKSAEAETMDFIKDGKIMARATALWKDDDPQEIKDRLFKLTVLVNAALSGLSGDYINAEQFGSLKNKIKISVVGKIGREVYALYLVKNEDGKELRIFGTSIDHTERAIALFLEKYLKLDYDTMKDLELEVNKIMKQHDNEASVDIEKIPFKKVKNLVFEQNDMEIRDPLVSIPEAKK